MDRIRSVEEAIVVEALGADLLTVSLDCDPRFGDDRTVAVETATLIRRSLNSAQCVAELNFKEHANRSLEIARLVGVDLVQPTTGEIPPLGVRRALRQCGIGIVYANIEVSHDDDPSWILSRFGGVAELNAAYFQIDLLPEYGNSWEFLRDESPGQEAEIQIDDINSLGSDHELLVCLNYTQGNFEEILSVMSGVAGMTLTLGACTTRNDFHYTDYPTLLSIMRAL